MQTSHGLTGVNDTADTKQARLCLTQKSVDKAASVVGVENIKIGTIAAEEVSNENFTPHLWSGNNLM